MCVCFVKSRQDVNIIIRESEGGILKMKRERGITLEAMKDIQRGCEEVA